MMARLVLLLAVMAAATMPVLVHGHQLGDDAPVCEEAAKLRRLVELHELRGRAVPTQTPDLPTSPRMNDTDWDCGVVSWFSISPRSRPYLPLT